MTLAHWNSLLFVAAHSAKHLQSAIRLRPDAVILDMEDSVATIDKPTARASLRHSQQFLAEAGIPCLLRINSDSGNMSLDVAAADASAMAGIIVPKCVNTQSLQSALDLSKVSLIALIESPAAIQNLHEIADLKSVQAMMFGPEDYAVKMGVSPHARAIEHAAALVAIAASAVGKPAFGVAGSLANFSDLEKFKQHVELTRDLGFSGALAIHPSQLSIIKTAFAPTQSEMTWAAHVIATQKNNSAGAFKLDGQMIDAPVVRRAERILARAGKT